MTRWTRRATTLAALALSTSLFVPMSSAAPADKKPAAPPKAVRDPGDVAVLLESFLDGPEVSLFCVVDGETVVPLLPAQDFKRVGDNDSGPNTGGMGAYTPLPWAPEGLVEVAYDGDVDAEADKVARWFGDVRAERAAAGSPTTGAVILTKARSASERSARLAILSSSVKK